MNRKISRKLLIFYNLLNSGALVKNILMFKFPLTIRQANSYRRILDM